MPCYAYGCAWWKCPLFRSAVHCMQQCFLFAASSPNCISRRTLKFILIIISNGCHCKVQSLYKERTGSHCYHWFPRQWHDNKLPLTKTQKEHLCVEKPVLFFMGDTVSFPVVLSKKHIIFVPPNPSPADTVVLMVSARNENTKFIFIMDHYTPATV